MEQCHGVLLTSTMLLRSITIVGGYLNFHSTCTKYRKTVLYAPRHVPDQGMHIEVVPRLPFGLVLEPSLDK